MTLYTYDTEFLEDGKTIDLISIGIVCEDGREYYAVNSAVGDELFGRRLSMDDWMMTNVVPHLPMRRDEKPYKFEGRSWIWSLDSSSVLIRPKWLIANEVREFLLAKPNPELWAYYSAYDHVALAQLWGRMISLPKGIPMWTHDIMQAVESAGPAYELPVQPPGNQHSALHDARWNALILNQLGIWKSPFALPGSSK